jgi:hypothetical protein
MTREQLYDLVWTMPATEVARKCAISNARLRKLCAEFNVPLPSAGYWTKIAYGKAADRPPLPANAPNLFSRINSVLRKLGEIPLRVADAQIADFDLDFSEPQTEAGAAVLHPAVEILKTQLAKARPDERGFVEARGKDVPFVRVGAGSTERVVRLVTSLMRACVVHGFEVGTSEHGLLLTVDDEQFCLRIYALRKRRSPQSPEPTGTLVLEFYDPRDFRWSGRNLVEQWRDRGGKRIEQSVDEFAAKLRSAAEIIKGCRAAVSGYSAHAGAPGLHALQREFLLQAADELARLEKLQALSDYLRAEKSATNRSALLFALEEAIAESRDKISREKLASEFLEIPSASNGLTK